MPSRKTRRERVSRWMWALVDAAIWVVAIFVAGWLRYEFQIEPIFVEAMLGLGSVAVAVHVIAGALVGPYAVGHQRGSFEETWDVARTVVITGLVLVAVVILSLIHI